MQWRTVTLVFAGTLWAWGTAGGTAIRSGFDAAALPKSELPSDEIPLGFNVNFFGTTYDHLYVNPDGNVTFGVKDMWSPPFPLTGKTRLRIIAPFFADVDTRGAGSDVVRYGSGTVDGHQAFGVDWINVGYFFKKDDKLNSFQLVLIDRSDRHPGDIDVEFNYDRIIWETGELDGGTHGLGGHSARAGYSSDTGAPGTFYELPGSGVPGSFLDGSPTGLVHHSYNSPIAGRYVFALPSGQPPGIPAPAALLLGGIGLALVGGLRRRGSL